MKSDLQTNQILCNVGFVGSNNGQTTLMGGGHRHGRYTVNRVTMYNSRAGVEPRTHTGCIWFHTGSTSASGSCLQFPVQVHPGGSR